MNEELFEQLLYEEESTTLDFKKEQYRFVKASDEEKSELLKDILGFANAWRRSEAYILIGVEDVRGGRSKVIGISDHLDDHSLQQFVKSLTNKPIRFHYEAFGFEGKQVGIIRIDEQARPIYLTRDYGRLMKEKVYVRYGSSTDPTKPASPDEIARMGNGGGHPAAELLVQFAHVERDDARGSDISWDAEFCEMPAENLIPDLSSPRQRHPFGLDMSIIQFNPMDRLNHDYFRERASFEFSHRLFRPVRLLVENIGQAPANNVRVEITVPRSIGVVVMDTSEMPAPPKRRTEFIRASDLYVRNPASRHDPGEVDIVGSVEHPRIEIDCGDLQPGRRVWSGVFYFGKAETGDFSLCGSVFADNLSRPKDFALKISVAVTKRTMTVKELCALPEVAVQDQQR